MKTFIFIKKDNSKMYILHGKNAKELMEQTHELNNDFYSYEWQNFCKITNKNEKVIDSNLDFNGKRFEIYHINETGPGYPEKGFYFLVDETPAKLMVPTDKKINPLEDIPNIINYVSAILDGTKK